MPEANHTQGVLSGPLVELTPEEKIRIGYAVRFLVNRCLQNPNLDDHAAPVLVNERDKLLDEIERLPEPALPEPAAFAARVLNGKPKRRAV